MNFYTYFNGLRKMSVIIIIVISTSVVIGSGKGIRRPTGVCLRRRGTKPKQGKERLVSVDWTIVKEFPSMGVVKKHPISQVSSQFPTFY